MGSFTFKSPEGQRYTVNGPDGATPAQAFGVVQQHIANQRAQGVVPASMKDVDGATTPPGPTPPTTPLADIGAAAKAAYGVAEPTISGLTGLAGKVAGGYGAVVQGAKNWLEGEPEGNATAADREQRIERAMTYQPRTDVGQGVAKVMAGTPDTDTDLKQQIIAQRSPSTPFTETVGPAIAEALTSAGPLLLGLPAAARTATGEAAAVRAAGPPTSPLEAVQRAGYQIRPSDVPARNPTVSPGDVPGSLRESLTSSPQQTEGMVRNNAALSTRLIGEDIGVPNATKLTEAHYQAAERQPGQVYDQTGQAIGHIETPAPSTVDNLRAVATDQTPQGAVPATARTQLNRMIEGLQSGRYSGTQLIHDISYLRNQVGGAGARAAADVLESEMEHQLQRQPETLAGFQAARAQFAKIRNARDSTTGGLIDAADYRRVSEANPRLLTGNSAVVAQAGGEIPHLTRIPRPTADQTPIAGTAFKTLANAAARGMSHLPFMDITRPALQARIGRAAPAPGPLPVAPGLARTAAPPPSPMGAPPGSVGVAPSQLGMALEPGRPAAPAFDLAPPEGSVFEPMQRGQALPPGQGRLNLTRQLLDQIRRRNGELPGTLSHDE